MACTLSHTHPPTTNNPRTPSTPHHPTPPPYPTTLPHHPTPPPYPTTLPHHPTPPHPRYPFSISAEQPLGEARLVLSVHYANREKDKFTDVVFNEIVELVPQPPAKVDPMVLAAAGGAALLLLLIVGCAGLRRGSRSPGAGAKKSKAASPVAGNEWLADTLAGTEGRPARARKQTKKRD